MRLYSYITNEKGILKQQGSNREMKIELLVEKKAGSWKSKNDKLLLFLRWNNDKSFLHLEIPENWKPTKTQSKNVFRFERVNKAV